MSRKLEEAIMDYLRASIAERGGTGRRLSKIWWQMDWQGEPVSDKEFSRAIERLRVAGRITIEEVEDFGFVYAVPVPE